MWKNPFNKNAAEHQPMTDTRAEHAFDAEESHHYRQQGYLVRENVFPEDELQTLRAAAARVSTKAQSLASTGTEYRLDGKRFVDKDGHTIQFEFADDLRLRVIEPIHTLDPEIDALVAIAQEIGPAGGVIGSRMTGGGFGGCTVSLVEAEKADAIAATLHERYLAATQIEPTCFVTRPAAGGRLL